MNITVSSILSGTLEGMKARFGGLAAMWLIFFLLTLAALVVFSLVLGGSMMAAMGGAAEGGAFGPGFGAGMFAVMAVFYVGYLLLACAQYGAMNAMASPLSRASFGDAFSLGWRTSPTLLAVMLIMVIGYLLVALALSALGAALGEIGALIASIVLFAAVIYLACRLAIVLPIAPVDGVRNPITVISRSWQLTRGHALPIFLSLLVFVLAVLVLGAILLVPALGAISSLSTGDAAPGIGIMLYLFVGFIALSVVFAAAYAAYLSAIHAQLSERAGEGIGETFA